MPITTLGRKNEKGEEKETAERHRAYADVVGDLQLVGEFYRASQPGPMLER